MTDYTEMTNEEINRAVAERLGYTMCADAPPHYDYVLMGIGGEFTEDWLVAANIDEAWKIVWGKDEDSVLSDYARDLNAAFELVADMRFEIAYTPNQYDGLLELSVEVWRTDNGYGGCATKKIQDAAAAICLAWLVATE